MLDAATRAVFHRVIGQPPPVAVRGEGVFLWDAAGRRYLDASGGAAVVNVGHGRAEVANAMAAQARTVAYVHGTHFTTGVLQEYAQRLQAHAPGEGFRLYPVSGGSEATETAVKLARSYHLARGEPARFKVITRRPSYHGNTLGALALSGRPVLREPYAPLLPPSFQVDVPLCRDCSRGRVHAGCGASGLEEIEALLRREGPETVSAFLAESIIGASAGVAVPPPAYAREARALCARNGVLYVADEVMTGFGRTGRWFAAEWAGLEPDLVTCGKGMSSGYVPVGAVLVRPSIAETVEAAGGFRHGFTFSHHPVAAAASLAVLEILERERLVERAAALEAEMRSAFSALSAHPFVGDLRGRGLLLGLELLADRDTRRSFARSERVTERLAAECLARGLVTYNGAGGAPDGSGDALLLAPPFVIEREQMQEAARIVGESLDALRLS
jgi:adenosylmethionine-8-amino-7-oxononanoate aminotransferase